MRYVIISAVVGVLLAAASITSLLTTASSAEAQLSPQPAGLEQVTSDLAPGSRVEVDSGGVRFGGRLTPAAAAEAHRMNELAEAGPGAVRCRGTAGSLSCTVVPDAALLGAIRSGETIYGRTVHSDVTKAVDEKIPYLEADELLCHDVIRSAKVLTCSAASAVAPTIAPDEKMLVTYKRYRLMRGGAPGALLFTRTPAVVLERG